MNTPATSNSNASGPVQDEQLAYDVFISYSSHDKVWVRGELLHRLETAGLEVCIDFRDFEPGAPSVTEMERAVLTSRKTLLVLTEAYLASDWTKFEHLMLQPLDPANEQLRLIPLLKEPCRLPPRIGYLTFVDFSAPDITADLWERLFRALSPSSPTNSLPPDTPASPASASSIPNPFTDRARINDPARFFGRRREVRELREHLRNGNSIALVGEREIGKSSLLAYLCSTQAEWQLSRPAVLLTFQTIQDEGHFCERLLDALREPQSKPKLRHLDSVIRRHSPVLLLDEVERLAQKAFRSHL